METNNHLLLLSESQLLLQRLGHLWRGRSGKTESNLHSVIDEPLESGESTDHDNSRNKTKPQSLEAENLDGVTNARARGLVEIGDESVGRVGDDSAEDTSDVSSSECDDQLLRLGALSARLGDHVLVDGLHGSLEAGKLHHGVGDLSSPQRNQRLVETIDTFLLQNSGESSSQSCGEGSNRRSLNSDLARFHWRQSNVSKELSRSRGSQVQRSSVQEGVLLSNHVRVDLLKDLIESKLAETLGRVANGSGSPAQEET